MPFFVTPNVIAIVILVVLAFLGMSQLFIVLGVNRNRGGKQVVLELGADADDITNLLASLSPPFSFEVAVSQLGKDPKYYVSVPARLAGKAMDKLDAKEVDDYDVYYTNGVNIGVYLKGEGSFDDLDVSKIDLSEVNEIGEGAVVQFLFNKKKRGKYEANGRILVSAPSAYQAKEIMTRIRSSLSGFKFVEVKNAEFMNRINSRKFDEKETIMLIL